MKGVMWIPTIISDNSPLKLLWIKPPSQIPTSYILYAWIFSSRFMNYSLRNEWKCEKNILSHYVNKCEKCSWLRPFIWIRQSWKGSFEAYSSSNSKAWVPKRWKTATCAQDLCLFAVVFPVYIYIYRDCLQCRKQHLTITAVFLCRHQQSDYEPANCFTHRASFICRILNKHVHTKSKDLLPRAETSFLIQVSQWNTVLFLSCSGTL